MQGQASLEGVQVLWPPVWCKYSLDSRQGPPFPGPAATLGAPVLSYVEL